MNSLSSLLHPHHVSFIERPHSLKAIVRAVTAAESDPSYDPYYAIDSHSTSKAVAPRFDVVETSKAYILEGEIPGVCNKSNITVEWILNRSLFVRGKIPQHVPEVESDVKEADDRPSTDAQGTLLPKSDEQRSQGEDHEGKPTLVEKLLGMPDSPRAHAHAHAHERKPHEPDWPRQLMFERHVGNFERSFTFPRQVDPDGMKARLDGGLLTIVVPKMKEEKPPHRILVE